jgi:glycerol-3-phosphate acyltransferase PlsY
VAIEFVLLVLAAYLLGSVPAAYLAARLSQGIDIRHYGSGNVGVANLWRLAPKWLAILVFIFDLAKGMVMVWVAQEIGLGIAEQVAVGVAAIIGHNWPVFLGFSGGRGILTTLGVVFILMPWGLVVFLAIVSLTILVKSSPLPVLAGIAALPLISWFFSQPLGIEEPLPVTLGFLAMFLIIVIRRLTARQPIAVSIGKKQLLLNRLLFDRDIRDKEAWIHRVPPEASSSKQPLGQQEKPGKG